MTSEVIGTVKSCFDNTKDGEYNYAIILNDETRLYYRGFELNPLFKNGDKIKYKIINTKHSAQGNPYTNIHSVERANDNAESKPEVVTNNFSNKNNSSRQELMMFVTGTVGRTMGGNHYSKGMLLALTEEAVEAFNTHLK